MSKIGTLSATVAICAALAGCAESPFNGFSDKQGAQISVAQNPYINGGKIKSEVYRVTLNLSGSCHDQHGKQLAGPLQSATGGAVTYGVGGGLGVGGGAQAAFGSAAGFGTYFPYGAIAGAGSGAVNGAVSGSYAQATATANCTREFVKQLNDGLADNEKQLHLAGKFNGLDIEAATAGKAPNDRPPALE